ncbi:hypothetical protein [Streptomyces pseudogriseolus]|uniref:hypothetical protein n=1 Tax=Streptomyces pseudogriseolus TaxID=36817 RepID=UPI001CE2CBF2|nr:hypothetical protein [Streptomyces pseudogriseolus]
MALPLVGHGHRRVEKAAGIVGVARVNRSSEPLAEFVGVAPGLDVRVMAIRVLFVPEIVLSVANELVDACTGLHRRRERSVPCPFSSTPRIAPSNRQPT